MEQSELGVSIILCCHNSVGRLPETLARLARQKMTSEIRWEVLVVDNASTDATAQVARQLWPSYSTAPLRVVREPRAGLAYARLRGLSEARYEFLSFIDDDNWVCDDWVQLVYSEMLAHPGVGILGGSSGAVCEVEPPEWFHQIKVLYAITPAEWQAGDFTAYPGTIWGAGMAVRKSAWQRVQECDCPQFSLGRLKNSMAGGEDSELCYQLRLAGWRLRYEPKLHFQHFLPAGRLRWEYVRRLTYGDGEATAKRGMYTQSLDRIANREEPSYKYGWFWKLATSIKDLLRHPVVLLRAVVLAKEGDPAVLAVAHLRGYIRMLLRLRTTYKSHLLEIEGFAARAGQAEEAKRETYAAPELARD